MIRNKLTRAFAVLGCLGGMLVYSAFVDTNTAESGLRVWVALTVTEAGMAAILGGLAGVLIGYAVVKDDPSAWDEALKLQSRGRRRRRKKSSASAARSHSRGRKLHRNRG